MCLSATRKICRKVSASKVRTWKANPNLTRAAFYAVIDKAVKKFPNVKAVATTLREVHSTNRHTWGAVAWVEWQNLSIADVRTGCGGPRRRRRRLRGGIFLRPAVRRQSEQEAVNLGWAHGALLTTFPGDTTMATVEQVKAFAKGGSARIQR